MAEDRSSHKLKAKWCEHAERYEDMKAEMTALIKLPKSEPLDEEERNLLSVAYKNVVGSRRSSYRVVKARLGEEQNEQFITVCQKMKKKIEEELHGLCTEVLDLLNKCLIPNPENTQATIFFLKMKGDYYRYMVEMTEPGTSRDELVNNSENAYKEAMKIAEEKLPTTSPIRLGLALNYSVFFYEIKDSQKEACELAKNAFEQAFENLDNVPEDEHKDSTLIMQLLRDNLTLWVSEAEQEQDDDN